MPSACAVFRSNAHVYRREEFLSGLARVGFSIDHLPKRRPEPGDLILVWNRVGMVEPYVQAYERVGATVIVAENGYISGADGEKRYALAKDLHNGAGSWRIGGPERLERLGLHLLPWRAGGDQVVLLPQRGIGSVNVAMPKGWGHDQLHALARRTRRRILFRRHPGSLKTEPYADLQNAHCAVTWGSGAAIKALAYGVPVFHAFPRWIGAEASTRLDGADLECPMRDDGARLRMFERLAWAQWSMGEIVSGEAFAWLLEKSPTPR